MKHDRDGLPECSPNCPLCNELTPEQEEEARSEEPTVVKISGTAATVVNFEIWREFDWKAICKGKGSTIQTTMPRKRAIEFAKYLKDLRREDGISETYYTWAYRNAERLLEQMGVEE